MELAKLIKVNKNRCVNCHRCVSVCPVKFANNGSGDYVDVVENLCIGCGECVLACQHGARERIDDFSLLIENLKKGEKVIAICSPAVVSNFPGEHLNLNGWFKSLGIKAFFDVSWGAELTIRSYTEYINERKPKLVISQQCPVIVSYIQIYHPELIPYLAPINSPTIHTIKMVKEFYSKYSDHKFMIISPCTAQKREMIETQMGDYNLTFANIEKHLHENNITLANFPMIDYSNEPAERGVQIHQPGGLTEILKRELPDIAQKARIITDTQRMVEYLAGLYVDIENDQTPMLLDILNCTKGCNAGTGTSSHERSLNDLESLIKKRLHEHLVLYNTQDNDQIAIKMLNKTIDKYWEKGLFIRTYKNIAQNYKKLVKKPDEKELTKTYNKLGKFTQDDIINCSSCGYNSCEAMAIAIYNNLNRKENCRFYLEAALNDVIKSIESALKEKNKLVKEKDKQIYVHKQEIIEQSESLLSSIQKMRNILE